MCLVAHERTCEESQDKKNKKCNSSLRSISYQFAHNKSIVTKKKLKILLKTLDKQNSTRYNTYKNYYETNKVTTKKNKYKSVTKAGNPARENK